MSKERHWTSRSLEDLRYSVGADFLMQVQKAMDERSLSQKQIAEHMGVGESAVSHLLREMNNNNLTLDTLLRLSAAVGMKPAIVLYETDGYGAPIHAGVFTHCWRQLSSPRDFWPLHEDGKPCEFC